MNRCCSFILTLALGSIVTSAFAATPTKAPVATPVKRVTSAKPVAGAGAKSATSARKGSNDIDDPVVFQKKLADMSVRTEKSIKLLREQIMQNQSAPFLADLFMQLGDLLTQKASVLYYQKIEREKDTNIKLSANEKSNPIVNAEQDAIEVYQQVLKEFPTYPKMDQVLYRLSVAHRAIDDGAAFVVTSERLLKEFPTTKESFQVRLLLGQYYIEQQDFPGAKKVLTPAADCAFPFERDSARHRLGIIAMSEEHYKEALSLFEKVATDDQLKDDDNPLEVSIKERTVKTNVRRDSLIDSVRAYTEVFKNEPDPIGYYSKIIPTEALFQETIEKLAYRYIFLKNELQAMKLLRNLSERTADPQKVVNTYREVLSIVPPSERIEVPPQEMRFVLMKYSAWNQNFEASPAVKADASSFFETQIREMGTKAHDLAKSTLSQARKDSLYERARQFYLLYLGYFPKSESSAKIATDLADVYYYQKSYLRSGDLYLRIFSGEFGPAKKKEDLLQNAILCLQKKGPSDFYEIVRGRGLLLRAINTYMQFNPKKKNDPQLNFALAKGIYEQGLYQRALNDLLNFVARFPSSTKEAEAATDLMLDYFNTRSDFAGLAKWSQKLLAQKTLPASLRARLDKVKSKAMMKQIDEQVKSKANYDPFAQGKVYFETALNLQDEALRSAALEQALARSKSEKDIGTFLKVAHTIADAEKNPDKKATILSAAGEQTLAIGRFYQTLSLWRQVLQLKTVSGPVRQRLQEKIVQLGLMLKDWDEISGGRGVNSTLQQATNEQFAAAMDSGAALPEGVLNKVDLHALSVQDLTSFYKGMFKTSPGFQARVVAEASSRCRSSNQGTLCRWMSAQKLHRDLVAFGTATKSAPAKVESIQTLAGSLSTFLTEAKDFTQTGDPQLDIFGSLHSGQAYLYLAEFLGRVGAANPALAPALKAKASESTQTGLREKMQCQKIIASASLISPINRACASQVAASPSEALAWPRIVADRSVRGSDPKSAAIDDLQKKIFADASKPENYLSLAALYYTQRNYHHAVALSEYGSSTFAGSKDDFATVKGCSLTKLGLYNEALFFLKAGSDFQNLKSGCLSELKEMTK